MKLACMVMALLLAPGVWAQQNARRMTDTPERDVLVRASDPEQGLVEFDCSKCSAMTDLLFVAARETCGNAGCEYYIFRKAEGKSYEYLTTTFMSVDFEFLKTKHHGMNDMLLCVHIDAGLCELRRSEFDGNKYQSHAVEEYDHLVENSGAVDSENVVQRYLNKNLKPTTVDGAPVLEPRTSLC